MPEQLSRSSRCHGSVDFQIDIWRSDSSSPQISPYSILSTIRVLDKYGGDGEQRLFPDLWCEAETGLWRMQLSLALSIEAWVKEKVSSQYMNLVARDQKSHVRVD